MEKSVCVAKKYKLIKKLGEGTFGHIYVGENKNTRELVAIKLENKTDNKKGTLKHEANIYKVLDGIKNIPRMRNFGVEGAFNYLIMDLLEESLDDLMEKQSKFSITYTISIAIELIDILHQIHDRGIVHRDLKPENFLIKNNKVFIIDFGLSKSYLDKDNNHVKMENNKSLIGTIRYASVNVHNNLTYSRRDDLESLAYILIYFLKGSLPWQGLKIESLDEKHKKIYDIKTSYNLHTLCQDIPLEFLIYLKYCHSLKYSEKPNYDYIKSLFTNLKKIHNASKLID